MMMMLVVVLIVIPPWLGAVRRGRGIAVPHVLDLLVPARALVGGATLRVMSPMIFPLVRIKPPLVVVTTRPRGAWLLGEVDVRRWVWQGLGLVVNGRVHLIGRILRITGTIVVVVTRVVTIATVMDLVAAVTATMVVIVVVLVATITVVVPGRPAVVTTPAATPPLAGAGLGGAYAGGSVARPIVELVDRPDHGVVQTHRYPSVLLSRVNGGITEAAIT